MSKNFVQFQVLCSKFRVCQLVTLYCVLEIEFVKFMDLNHYVALIAKTSIYIIKRKADSYFPGLHREWSFRSLQKGGVPATPSGTATLLRLNPSYRFYPRPLLSVTDFRHPQLPWFDGRCVQGPGTYSPRRG